jgi:methionyl-tRNA formyltransferase
MRLVFFGSGSFGLPSLQRLLERHEAALVVTQPDRPAGRHRALTPTPIGDFAAARGLRTIKPEKVNQPDVVAAIRAVDADAFVVIAYGHKLGPALLQDRFAINLHGSLLPKYRGAAPINWAMINGETETGVTVITLAQTMDAGDVLDAASTPIGTHETAGELHDRLALLGPEVLLRTLEAWEHGTLQPRKQDERLATPAPKLSKADGTVRFDQSAQHARQRVHGLTPWPGCAITLDGQPLRLARVEEAAAQRDRFAGELLPDHTIACAAGSLRLLEVQPPGGRIMRFAEYCNGRRVPIGSRAEPLTVP